MQAEARAKIVKGVTKGVSPSLKGHFCPSCGVFKKIYHLAPDLKLIKVFDLWLASATSYQKHRATREKSHEGTGVGYCFRSIVDEIERIL